VKFNDCEPQWEPLLHRILILLKVRVTSGKRYG